MRTTGFTFIEIIMVLVILGILCSINYPLYSAHILKSRRSAIAVVLLDAAGRLEEYYAQNNSFSGTSLEQLGVDTKKYRDYYAINLSGSDDTYLLRADPVNKQIDDTTCGALSLDQNGNKNITGSGSIAECWG